MEPKFVGLQMVLLFQGKMCRFPAVTKLGDSKSSQAKLVSASLFGATISPRKKKKHNKKKSRATFCRSLSFKWLEVPLF